MSKITVLGAKKVNFCVFDFSRRYALTNSKA